MGTMKEADDKVARRISAISVIILIIVYGMVYFGWFNTYLHDFFERAHIAWNILSVPFALGSIYLAAAYPFNEGMSEKNGFVFGLIVIVLVLIAITMAGGFEFSMRGIIER